jgi:hydrogenase expression/formation protein HypC
MCLAIPGQIVALEPGVDLARVDVVGVTRTINVALLGPDAVGPGDWVLIHVGFAMAKIDEAEARQTLATLQAMGQIWDDEMDALRTVPPEPGG